MDIKQKLQIWLNTSIVSGIFCLVVAILLIFNFWQVSSHNPLESEALNVLVERLSQEPRNDELKQEIRNLDLLARKAYFNSQWQVKTGTYLLLFGAIIFAIALRFYTTLKSKIEQPGQQVENEQLARVLSQKWLIWFGAGVLVLAVTASFFTVDHLESYSATSAEQTEKPEGTPEENIQVVQVKKDVPEKQETVEEEPNTTENKENIEQEKVVQPSPELVKEEVVTTQPKVQQPSVNAPSDRDIKNNSNSFRGAFGNGVSTATNIPVSWDVANGQNVKWKTTLPKHGYNSPVIWGDKVFLTGADQQGQELYCLDKNSGKMLWVGQATNVPGAPEKPPKVTEDTGLAAPSVTTDGNYVVAIFGTGTIICFDMEGNKVWARNLGVPDNHYGHSSSLLTYANKIFVQYDTNRGSKVMALFISSGETIWETKRTSNISWASPVLAEVAGKKQLVLTADPNVAGYDIDTGKELWSVDCMMGEVGPSVAFGEGLVFASNEYARLVAIDPTTSEIKWEDDEYLPEVASPVVTNGLLFIATSYGVLVCYDALNGEKQWEEEYNAGFYGSPVIAENKLFALDMDGIMHILEVSRDAKVIGTPELGEEGFTTPAFANGIIIVRGNQNLFCFGN